MIIYCYATCESTHEIQGWDVVLHPLSTASACVSYRYFYLSWRSCVMIYAVYLLLSIVVFYSVFNTFSPSSFWHWRTNPYPSMDVFLYYTSIDGRAVCQTVFFCTSFWSITRTTLYIIRHSIIRMHIQAEI